MRRPHLLDAFCGAGGAGMGYWQAGFDVTGVDIAPQSRYPFDFHQGDAIEFIEAHGHKFDAIHASPPCQDHSPMKRMTKTDYNTGWMLPAVRGLLNRSGNLWVIENVPGAPMRSDITLCGCMFDVNPHNMRRCRLFETSWRQIHKSPVHNHNGIAITITGHGMQRSELINNMRYNQDDRKEAMGITWMNRGELSQAIPPRYTEYIGRFLLAEVQRLRLRKTG